MIKLKPLLFESKILVPRRTSEEREKTLIAGHHKIIQRYIKDGCRGKLNLSGSPIKILPDNLTHVGGDLNLHTSKIESLNNLERVDGNLNLFNSEKMKNFGKLNYVNKGICLSYTTITKIPDFIVTVNGDFKLAEVNIEDLNNLEQVNGHLDLSSCKNLKSLGKLKYVDGDLYVHNSYIRNLMTREKIRRHIDIMGMIYD
jgi:hypothetical protein